MLKAVRMGDLVFVPSDDGFKVSHLYPGAAKGRRFRLSEASLTPDEVRGIGVDPETGLALTPSLRLNHMSAGDHWCLLLEDARTRITMRILGRVPDEVVSNVFYYRTPETTQFSEITHDRLMSVRKAREESAFRARLIAHMDDSAESLDVLREIRDILSGRAAATATKRRPAKRRTETQELSGS